MTAKNKNRIRVQLPQILTRREAEDQMNRLAITINNQRKLIANRDAEVLAVNKRYEANLAKCDEAVQASTSALEAWALANPAEFPAGRKSLELVAGKLGFRTGNPKLSLLSRAFNWEKVLTLVQSKIAAWVRTKHEVDKEAILAAYASRQTTDNDLRALGLQVIQDETFFIEPNLTDLEKRQINNSNN